jgi:uncharacterized membrane protein YhaH (DUF805 family)
MTAIAGHMNDYHEQVDMAEAVRRAFANFGNFKGRANRGEFWWFFLATVIVNIVLTMVDNAMWGLPILSLLWSLFLFIPGLSLTVRRFHDIGKSGWSIFIVLIPIAGIVLYLVWLCRQGEPTANRFG